MVVVDSRRDAENPHTLIQVRYVDDTDTVPSYTGCGITPPETPPACVGPFIWKPGKSVEVTIPTTITDVLGRGLKRDFVYRFTIAPDTVPFQILDSRPRPVTLSLRACNTTCLPLCVSVTTRSCPISLLTITPPAEIFMSGVIAVDGKGTPTNLAHFAIRNMQSGAYYEITIPPADLRL